MTTPPNLTELRARIDAIDTEMLALIRARAEIAHQVSQVKGKPPYWRPAREAQILRSLQARHGGVFPLLGVLELWARLMTLTTTMEGGLKVALPTARRLSHLDPETRAYFGAAVPLVLVEDERAALDAAARDETVVAVLPWPAPEDNGWWADLAGPDGPTPRFVFQLPAYADDPEIRDRSRPRRGLVVAARVVPEAIGDDESWLIVDAACSTDRCLDALAARGFAEPVLFAQAARGDGALLRLIGVDGFVARNDPRVAPGEDPLARIIPVGTAARPLLF